MMNKQLVIIALAFMVMLAGCSTTEAIEEPVGELKSEQAVNEAKKVEEVTESEKKSLPPRTSEGLSLTDSRVGIEPTSLEIPKLNVNASIEDVGRIENGQMGVPQDPDNIGWFEPGILPGAQGNAVMAGHIDSLTGPSVFYELDKLEEGDEIIVHGDDNETLRFIVTGSKVYPRNDSPVDEIFGFNYSSGLTLITCTGEYNRSVKTHEERLVVYTELVQE